MTTKIPSPLKTTIAPRPLGGIKTVPRPSGTVTRPAVPKPTRVTSEPGMIINPIGIVAKKEEKPVQEKPEFEVNMTPVDEIKPATEEPVKDKIIMTEEELGFEAEKEESIEIPDEVVSQLKEKVKEEIKFIESIDEDLSNVNTVEENVCIEEEEKEVTIETKEEETSDMQSAVELVNEMTDEQKEECSKVLDEVIETIEETKKKSKSKSKSKKKPEVEIEQCNDNIIEVDDSVEVVALAEIEDFLTGVVVPVMDEWTNEKAKAEEEIRELIIDADMTPYEYTVLLAKIDTIKTDLLSRYLSAKSAHEQWFDKDGFMEQVKTLKATGKNSEERRRSSMLACRRYIPEGADKAVNLFDAGFFVKDRYTFYKGLLEHLESKRQLIITISAMLKIQINF